jgi:hypothetical protein
VTGTLGSCRRRPGVRDSAVGCARRRPVEKPEDAGSIPATSKSVLATGVQVRTLLEVVPTPQDTSWTRDGGKTQDAISRCR